MGRMLSPDDRVTLPWNKQAHDKYSYANNNPLVYRDAEGHFLWFIPLIIGAAIVYLSPVVGVVAGSAITGIGNGVMNGDSFLNILLGTAQSAILGGVSAGLITPGAEKIFGNI